MNIHEYRGKALPGKFGMSVPCGCVAFTPAETVAVAQEPAGSACVVKAQIHAGGPGKSG
ncbi:MAG: hypothetical protein KAJ65_07105 [Gammaproteobacteria bacterium]|nr:hypothetical protein [Gammaproteobacteria bacterium]